MIKAQLVNLGRHDTNKMVNVKDISELREEIGKHILSPGWGMEETEEPGTWEVYAGLRTVGHVRILEN